MSRARVSASLRRLSNLNPIAAPKAKREREREKERNYWKNLKERNKISPSGQDQGQSVMSHSTYYRQAMSQ